MSGMLRPILKRRIVTHCSVCTRAVYVDQPALWQRTGRTGIVHVDCATDPDAVPMATEAVTNMYPDL